MPIQKDKVQTDGVDQQPGRPFNQMIHSGALASYRLDMLNRQLIYATENSRFYSSRMPKQSLPLASLEAFRDLPFTCADDIKHSALDMVCVDAGQVERIVTINSTGSSDSPKRLFFSEQDLAHTVDFFSVGMRYMCGVGDSVMICMPGRAEHSIGRLLAKGLGIIGAKANTYGIISNYPAAVAALRHTAPRTIVGIPAQIRKLALLAPDIRPANVLLSADYVSHVGSATLSRIWGCEVFTHYGLTESAYGCAVECPAHAGQHIRHDELYLEIVSPDGTDILPDGQWGEIVITTLRREAMPIIRYRTGDIGRLLHKKCACGSFLPRLDHVRGRISELAHEINIYALDELLLGDDRVLDYQASYADGRLTVGLEAASADAFETCRKLLHEQWPDLQVSLVQADNPAVGWTVKRSIARRLC